MEQTTETKKDAWYTAYKNFLHLAYLLIFVDAVMLYFYFFNNSDGTVTVWVIATLVAVTTIWYGLAYLFKTRNKYAVIAGLILVGFTFGSSLIEFNVIGILVTGYFLYLVYKVRKISTVLI